MAQSIRDIICDINNALANVFKGAQFYGVAQLVEKEGKLQPVVNEKSVSFDDSFAMQTYHRLNTVIIKKSEGYGDGINTSNTFSVSVIVFNNEKRTSLKSDEIAMIFQSYFNKINISAVLTPVSVILNTQAIWATEYRGHAFALPEYMSLFQMNYNVEITFKSGCFDLCPEDFSQCKNN